MASIYTVWTTKGKAMAAEQLGPNNPITFTRVAASSKDYSSTDPTTLAALTKLDSEQQKGYIAYSNIINPSTLHMELLFKNSEATKNYNLCAVGLYATGSDKQEYLYSITVLQDPQAINPDSAGSTFGLSLNTVVGDATTAKVTITDAGAITQAILDAGLSTKQNLIGYTPADDSKVVHNSGTETIDGKKKFDTDPTDSAGNAYAKTVYVNQQLDKKVNIADMRKPASDVAGIEEVNAKQDKIGYTPANDSKVVHTTDTSNWQKQAMFNPGDYKIDITSPTTDFATLLKSKYNKAGVVYIRENNGPSYITEFIDAVVICEGGSYWYAYGIGTNGNFVHRQITPSSDTGWVLNADDSQVVHSKDMRKPASDVAGIEEVNTKQDKINYTPADDSKVAHNSGDETIGGTKTFTNPIKGTTEGITYRYSAPGDDLDTSYMNDSVIFVGTNKVANAPAGTSGTWAIIRNYNSNATNGAQSYYDTNQGVLYVRTRNSNTTYTQWIQVADDSKVAHLSGANNFDTVPTVKNNPLLLASSLPSDLARTGQANTFNLTQTFSQGVKTLQTGSYDDANSLVNEGLYYNTNSSIKNGAGSLTTGYIQVMSGYGEIVRQIMYSDTDGGVIYERASQTGGSSWSDWTQIVTWDQLPSNMVLNNQPQTFTAQQTFSTAPIDQTTGHPYITKDGVPSDVARTGQSQTFTASQTFSSAPTILDTSSSKGDNQVALMGDLKSLENSAWCVAHTGDDYMILYQKSSTQVWIFGTLPDAMDFDNLKIAFKESSNVLGIPSMYSEDDRSGHENWYFYQIGTLNNSFDKLKSTYFEVQPNFVVSFPNSYFINYGYLCIKNKILYIGLYLDPSDTDRRFNAGASINVKVPLASN